MSRTCGTRRPWPFSRAAERRVPRNTSDLSCNPYSIGTVLYINYTLDPLDNITLRPEWYDDPFDWRTGTGGRTQYADVTISWQHWLSSQITLRPKISYWRSIGTPAFNGNSIKGIPANKRDMGMFAADIIFHF
jgi:hypothetical protein